MTSAKYLSKREESECRKAEIRWGDGPLPKGHTCYDCGQFTEDDLGGLGTCAIDPRDPRDYPFPAPDGDEPPPSWCPRSKA